VSEKMILIVDDKPNNLSVLREILKQDYKLAFAKGGQEALTAVKKHQPDLILLDIMMPDMDGYEVCQRLKADEESADVPIIFVTAMSDIEDETKGFEVGGVDYITKPVSSSIVRARVATHLSLVRVKTLEKNQLAIIQRLGRAAEFKDNETGLHVIRMSHYAHILALATGMNDADAEMLFHAAPMHDVGKIGIPDHILLKPGALDKDEYEQMKKHAEIGAGIIGQHNSQLLKTAYTIAYTHHEKWDGSGYPQGLKAEEIPLLGRIVAIADVFDALTSERPYKKAWSIDKATNLLREEAGRHFDAELIKLFLAEETFGKVLKIREQWAETSS